MFCSVLLYREKSLGLDEVLMDQTRTKSGSKPSTSSLYAPMSPPASPPPAAQSSPSSPPPASNPEPIATKGARKKSIRFADVQQQEPGSAGGGSGGGVVRERSEVRRGRDIMGTGVERTPSVASIAYTANDETRSFTGSERKMELLTKEYDWEDEDLKMKKARPTDVGTLFRTDPKFRRGLAGFFVFLSWAYFMIATSTSEYYNCKKNKSTGHFFMEKDSSVRCWDFANPNLHTYILPASIASLIFYILGIPLLFATLLFSQSYWLTRRKKILASRTSIGRSKYSEKDLKNVFALEETMGFLFKRYRSNAFWWELLVLGRKLVFAIMVFLGQVEKILVIT